MVRGYQEYHCSNPDCPHVKYIHFTCKCKACSSCGKKATELWIKKQHQILPRTSWQHITFTMPSEFWDFFWYNRELLNVLPKLAADSIKSIANNKKITPGIFIALHTFGRDLKRNVHVHVSVTTGGLSEDGALWRKLYFDQKTLMRLWRYKVVTLFRTAYQQDQLVIPNTIQQDLNPVFTFSQFLNKQYEKIWIIHCANPENNHKINVNYLGRYIKRPPIAESKLKHYDGNEVTFAYLDHTTKTYQDFKLTSEQFIARLVQHIPDIGFRMIRYYGFLAHRVRGTLLPIVYHLLGQKNPGHHTPPTFAELIQQNFGFNPFTCILCGEKLVLATVHFGASNHQLLNFYRELALLKKILL